MSVGNCINPRMNPTLGPTFAICVGSGEECFVGVCLTLKMRSQGFENRRHCGPQRWGNGFSRIQKDSNGSTGIQTDPQGSKRILGGFSGPLLFINQIN